MRRCEKRFSHCTPPHPSFPQTHTQNFQISLELPLLSQTHTQNFLISLELPVPSFLPSLEQTTQPTRYTHAKKTNQTKHTYQNVIQLSNQSEIWPQQLIEIWVFGTQRQQQQQQHLFFHFFSSQKPRFQPNPTQFKNKRARNYWCKRAESCSRVQEWFLWLKIWAPPQTVHVLNQHQQQRALDAKIFFICQKIMIGMQKKSSYSKNHMQRSSIPKIDHMQ